jgi:pseudomonalisin
MEAAAQGQTVFASAGDTGGFCPVGVAANGVPAGAPDVSYPASSVFIRAGG